MSIDPDQTPDSYAIGSKSTNAVFLRTCSSNSKAISALLTVYFNSVMLASITSDAFLNLFETISRFFNWYAVASFTGETILSVFTDLD